jgi:hypothetical protein
LTAAGFTEELCPHKGCKHFKTSNFEIVSRAFDCLQHTNPLMNFSTLRSEDSFQLSKEAANMQHAPLVRDLRKARVGDLRRSASHEVGLPEVEIQNMTRVEAIKCILDKRISSQSYIGLSDIYHVVVDEEHPFTVLVKPGHCAKAFIKLKYTVTRDAINFNLDQQPDVFNVY